MAGQSLEISGATVHMMLVLLAEDLQHDESIGIKGSSFQSRVSFHQRLFDFVWDIEPTQVERYKLVKIVDGK